MSRHKNEIAELANKIGEVCDSHRNGLIVEALLTILTDVIKKTMKSKVHGVMCIMDSMAVVANAIAEIETEDEDERKPH